MTIGETLADPGDPRPLPVITVDEPSLSITVGISTSPLAGKDRSKLTARQIRDRLDQELVGNVSIGFARSSGPTPGRSRAGGAPAGRPPGDDAARGIRADRRPAADLTRNWTASSASRSSGSRSTSPRTSSESSPRRWRCARRGWNRWSTTRPAGSAPVPGAGAGLIGFRTEFLTETRTGLMHHVFEDWEPWVGDLRARPTRLAGRRPAREDRGLRLFGLQERGTLFVGPGEDVYEGMVIGENSRAEDIDVNAIGKSIRRTSAPRQPTSSSASCPPRGSPSNRPSSSCARTKASR